MKYDEKWVWGTSRFFPHEITEMMRNVFILLMVLTVFVVFWPGFFIPREEPADPMNTPEHIKPEWYFIGAYQALKEFKAVTVSNNLTILGTEEKQVTDPEDILIEISGEVQGIVFQVAVLMMMFFVPFWENGTRPPNERKANKIASGVAIFGILFLIVGIISNLRQDAGFYGIILHLLVIFSLLTLPFWFGMKGRSVWRKKPLFIGALIGIIGFLFLTFKGILI
ncbi:hypothetical protein ACFL6L_03845 [candidate division KSB1 bacterium]